jgi:hypothetical protein
VFFARRFGPAEAVPLLQSQLRLSFSAVCEARCSSRGGLARLKPCRCYKTLPDEVISVSVKLIQAVSLLQSLNHELCSLGIEISWHSAVVKEPA